MEEYKAKTAKDEGTEKKIEREDKKMGEEMRKKPWKGWYPVSMLHSFV